LRDNVREETLGLLRQLDTTAIMVTHDPEEALSAGDRVVLMQRGRIVQSGTGYEIHDNPKTRYAADFFCAFNKIEGRVRQGRVETPLGLLGDASDLPDGLPAVAYVRPNAISIIEDAAKEGIAGEISSRVFLGEIEQLGIAVPGLPADLRVRTMQRTAAKTRAIRFGIDPKGVLIFT